MNVTVGNVRAGWRTRATWIVVPALVVVFALSGFTVRPLLDVRVAAARRDAARSRLDAALEARSRNQRHRAQRDLERVESALKQLRALIPQCNEPIATHGLVRVVADALGLELMGLSIGADRELELAGDFDRLVAREVCLALHTNLPTMLRFLAALRDTGQPLEVLELGLERDAAEDLDFHARLCLGLIQAVRGSPPTSGETNGADASIDEESLR